MEVTKNMLVFLFLLYFYYSCFFVGFVTGTAKDTIKFPQFIKDSETLVSNGGVFKLGFFSPVNSTNRYLGIWYSFSTNVVVWVANRDSPLKDNSNGTLTISMDGNLVLSNAKGKVVWSSSNISNPLTMTSNSSSSAQLLDSGNFVLKDYQGTIVWQSFTGPADTFLPKMRSTISTNSKPHTSVKLTSWKSISDPSMGRFSAGLESRDVLEAFVWKEDRLYWRTGPWNGQYFLGTTYNKMADNKDGTVYVNSDFVHNLSLSRIVLNWQGQLSLTYWSSEKEEWEVLSSAPDLKCGVYATCGAFGSCSSFSSPQCRCLRGFDPTNIQEWNRGNWTSGCVRRKPLQCNRLNNNDEDGFLKLKEMKVPDSMILSPARRENCQEECMKNCSCTAYAFDSGIGCMLWSGNLIDLQQFPKGTGGDLYIRLAHSELKEKRNMAKVIASAVIIGALVIATGAYFLYRWTHKQRGRKQEILLGLRGSENQKFRGENMNISHNRNQAKLQELGLFNFEDLAMATNNFHSDNMLGKGGFGQVYWGKLEDGREIAVKRLSQASSQGVVEFTNEVVVISELQHRNLVKLLGCCVDEEEKMLIYEYLPNKSLDTFVFDPVKKELLDWRKRFNIIEGIGRGLLYLHRDSRLKIIHRDLKPSNILLDEELNPKISDFGMAKIFQDKEDHANTRTVVGTYGYMSPEYAVEGLFSEKSDVFSFGVLLLEIVSGRRSSSFRQHEEFFSFLQFVWKLWNENNIMALTDPALLLCNQDLDETEIKRCIQVGLLCVQESARIRPTMPGVLSMLKGEIVDLPAPNKPAFTVHRHIGAHTGSSSQPTHSKSSNYNASITSIHGR